MALQNLHPVVSAMHPRALRGRRSWWAHLAFTRINIGLIIRQNQIED
jgi:hypothetical protein